MDFFGKEGQVEYITRCFRDKHDVYRYSRHIVPGHDAVIYDSCLPFEDTEIEMTRFQPSESYYGNMVSMQCGIVHHYKRIYIQPETLIAIKEMYLD